MTREELIDEMVRAFRNDGEWPDNVMPSTANQDRNWMARAFDAIEPLIRSDERERFVGSTDDGAKSVFRRAYLDWAEWGRESRQLSLGALDAAFEALDAYRRGGR